jgi:hypothetical protein
VDCGGRVDKIVAFFFFVGGNLGEVLLSGLENQEKEVFPRKKEKSPF